MARGDLDLATVQGQKQRVAAGHIRRGPGVDVLVSGAVVLQAAVAGGLCLQGVGRIAVKAPQLVPSYVTDLTALRLLTKPPLAVVSWNLTGYALRAFPVLTVGGLLTGARKPLNL